MTDTVTIYQDSSGQDRWRYQSDANDKIMADSAEGYRNNQHLNEAIDTVFGGEPPIVVDHDGSVRHVPVDPALAAALTLLTLMTGDDWTRDRLVLASDTIRDQAKQVLVARGEPADEAERIVEKRWAAYGSPQPTTQAAVKDKPAEVATSFQTPSVGDMRERFRKMKSGTEFVVNHESDDDNPKPQQ